MYTYFKDLPILWVDNYDIVTKEFLEIQKKQFEKKSYTIEQSSLHYWIKQIHNEINKKYHNTI